MATQTLERPSEVATDFQNFRLTFISFEKEVFSLKYELNEGEEWSKPKASEVSSLVCQTGTSGDILKGVIRRAFEAEHWINSSVGISSLKLTYVGIDDKPKKGVEPRMPGELVKIAIASSFRTLTLGTFDQIVDAEKAGQDGYLDESELKALQDILNEVGRELARQLNKKTVFKPQQMKLF
jgi:hypothetical protein